MVVVPSRAILRAIGLGGRIFVQTLAADRSPPNQCDAGRDVNEEENGA
jgi:hypothetical protein